MHSFQLWIYVSATSDSRDDLVLNFIFSAVALVVLVGVGGSVHVEFSTILVVVIVDSHGS